MNIYTPQKHSNSEENPRQRPDSAARKTRTLSIADSPSTSYESPKYFGVAASLCTPLGYATWFIYKLTTKGMTHRKISLEETEGAIPFAAEVTTINFVVSYKDM